MELSERYFHRNAKTAMNGNGLMWPPFMSILSKRAGTVFQGTVQGIAGSFGGLASIIGLYREEFCLT